MDYDRDVRPLLSENCFYCHGQDANKRKGKLQLNTLEGQRAHVAVVPGNTGKSELVVRVFSTDPEEQMPPPESHRTLTQAQKELLERWVAEGAEFTGIGRSRRCDGRRCRRRVGSGSLARSSPSGIPSMPSSWPG